MSLTAGFNRNQTRAAFRLSHPTGNILTMEIVGALRSALESALSRVDGSAREELDGHGA